MSTALKIKPPLSLAGELALITALATEWSAYGVRVNVVAPGSVETDLNRAPDCGQRAQAKISQSYSHAKIWIGGRHWAGPPFIYVRPLAFVTGTVLPVDGEASIGF